MAVSLQIDEELSQEILRLAEVGRHTPEEILREAVSMYARIKDSRLDFSQEADASWTAFQDDALHLTGAEISSWLKTVGTDEETEIPMCHK